MESASTFGQVETFLQKLSDASDLPAIYDALDKQIRNLGFDTFAYLVINPPTGPHESTFITTFPKDWSAYYSGLTSHLYLGTYPEEWSAHYYKNDYVNVDPVMSAACGSLTPFAWTDLHHGDPPNLLQRRMLDEAGDFGLRHGITVPVHGPAQAFATLNIATRAKTSEFAEMWAQHRHVLHLIALHSHEAIVQKVLSEAEQGPIQLAPRERECLLWAARGKTAWEISVVLGLSEHTVIYYLKSAARKLNVHTKVHAVVKALLLGLIAP